MSDYDNLKTAGKLDEVYGNLNATLEMLKIVDVSSQPTQEQYNKLVEKFEQAMQLIESQKTKIKELQSNKIPTKDEVESMSAMLDILNKLDIKTLDKLSMLGKAEKK